MLSNNQYIILFALSIGVNCSSMAQDKLDLQAHRGGGGATDFSAYNLQSLLSICERRSGERLSRKRVEDHFLDSKYKVGYSYFN